MLDIINLLNESAINVKGVIHVGAYDASERDLYKSLGAENIVWIEANPALENMLREKIGDDLLIIKGVGNTNDKKIFNIANNGQSSSFLDFELHKIEHPNIYFEKSIEIEVNRMVNIIDDYNIDIKLYNYLSLDIQGFELEVLKGFDDLLYNFDFICAEVNEKELYKNCPIISELDEYLNKYNFKRKKTHMTPHGWGDALYVKTS